MGWPVSHSASPRLHGHWLQRYGIDGAYVPMAVRPEAIERALRALPLLGFVGANLTIPHKEAALSMVDEVTPAARRIGAINTVTVEGSRLFGTNTDGFGFVQNIKDAVPDFGFVGARCLVIGAGGAARAVVASLKGEEAAEILLANRTESRAEDLLSDLAAPGRAVAWSELETVLDGIDLLVNTTSLGMAGQPSLDLDLRDLPEGAVVNDLVYVPLETPLLAAAKARHRPVDGLGMLLHQARPGFEAWFGRAPEVDDALRRAVLEGGQP